MTNDENDRYGVYIITMCLIAQEHPKFKNKPKFEREQILEQQYLELLQGITKFDPNKGSTIYSYAYRIAWVAAVHYYTINIDNVKKKQAIEKHCLEELNDYLDEYNDHKVRNINDKDFN